MKITVGYIRFSFVIFSTDLHVFKLLNVIFSIRKRTEKGSGKQKANSSGGGLAILPPPPCAGPTSYLPLQMY